MAKNQARGKPDKRSRPRKQAGKQLFTLNWAANFGLDLEFDLADFDLMGQDDAAPDTPDAPDRPGRRKRGEKQRDLRILRPRLDEKTLSVHAAFENAQAFARQIDLTPGARTFAWVSGNFIFGDIVEALITARRVGVKRLYIATLSASQENIDSLKNVMLLMGDAFERLVLMISGWEYSRYKYDLVPYMYQELDDPANRVQIAFGKWHVKLMTMETVHGHTITIHGSANLRSANTVEQIMVEIDNRPLHDFNAQLMEHIADRFGTINHGAPYQKFKPVNHQEVWEVCEQWHPDPPAAEAATEAATEAAAAPN